ncbi:glycosyltransferase [uncultured Methanobrevibacter sp.]|uniref:glycosyltransferase n=1 Tax=uncultured Methanobrevibacter sp. TaxID=253161 RepID=UPI0026131C99|nr:glycosyltransferase [uncultured Methanobrevibacter sp.]
MPKVSVVIPVYNASDYLRESLECILNQTLDDLEVICVDDGSEDNSLEILNEIAQKDTRVKVLSQTNQGGGAARNNALKHTTGEYLYFMDADDRVDLNALKELYEISEEKNLDFAIFKAINYAEDTGEYFETAYYNMDKIRDFAGDNVFSGDDLGELIFNISVTPWCKFYNHDFVQMSGAKFLEGSIFHDNQFFWEVLFNAERMCFIDKAYYTRRRHSASSTGAGDERYINIINVVNNIINLFVKYGKLDKFRKILYNKKVFWIHTRYLEIMDEFKHEFYCEMKRDFANIEDRSFRGLLDDENRFIFDSIIKSKTQREFDLLIKNYRLTQENIRLKKQKELSGFLKYRIKKIVK